MKKFFSKRIRIFGKAIPLSLIIASVLVVAALAGWALSMITTISLTAKSFNGSLVVSSANIIGDGQVDSFDNDSIVASDLTNLSKLRIDIIARNDDPLVAFDVAFSCPTDAVIDTCTCVMAEIGGDCQGAVIPALEGGTAIDVEMTMGGLTAGVVVPDFDYTLTLTEQ